MSSEHSKLQHKLPSILPSAHFWIAGPDHSEGPHRKLFVKYMRSIHFHSDDSETERSLKRVKKLHRFSSIWPTNQTQFDQVVRLIKPHRRNFQIKDIFFDIPDEPDLPNYTNLSLLKLLKLSFKIPRVSFTYPSDILPAKCVPSIVYRLGRGKVNDGDQRRTYPLGRDLVPDISEVKHETLVNSSFEGILTYGTFQRVAKGLTLEFIRLNSVQRLVSTKSSYFQNLTSLSLQPLFSMSHGASKDLDLVYLELFECLFLLPNLEHFQLKILDIIAFLKNFTLPSGLKTIELSFGDEMCSILDCLHSHSSDFYARWNNLTNLSSLICLFLTNEIFIGMSFMAPVFNTLQSLRYFEVKVDDTVQYLRTKPIDFMMSHFFDYFKPLSSKIQTIIFNPKACSNGFTDSLAVSPQTLAQLPALTTLILGQVSIQAKYVLSFVEVLQIIPRISTVQGSGRNINIQSIKFDSFKTFVRLFDLLREVKVAHDVRVQLRFDLCGLGFKDKELIKYMEAYFQEDDDGYNSAEDDRCFMENMHISIRFKSKMGKEIQRFLKRFGRQSMFGCLNLELEDDVRQKIIYEQSKIYRIEQFWF